MLRILQEVLTNIVKHSGAREITVSTAEQAQGGVPGVVARIADDGRPFSPPPPEALPPGRRGLGNIRSRVALRGGDCAWAPGGERGTVFTLWLPLRRG